MVENPPSARDLRDFGFDPWMGKIPWRRAWQPTPVFFLENPMDRGALRAMVTESDMTVTEHAGIDHSQWATQKPLGGLGG